MKNKILVIEDNTNILEEVLTWLELEDYVALGATSGTQGLQVAFEQSPNLILCDIMMPEKDGYRVLLELRANQATALTPFIFMTAKQEKSDIRHGMELGADDYITKPFGRDEFLGAVRSRLERRYSFASHSEQQLANLRDRFFRTLPHELRTPLVGILGIGQLLAQDAYTVTPSEILEYAQMLTVSGEQLFRLIENHLLYVQLELQIRSGVKLSAIANGSALDPVPLLHEICAKCAHIHHRINDLHLDLAAGKLAIAEEHLAKILYELTDNAFKFSTPSNLVQIDSQLQEEHYQITIHDHGHGIKAADMAKIGAYMQFERDRYEQQGAGLGLTIARLLTELNGGSLQVTSDPCSGTSVTVSLPIWCRE